MSLLPFPVVSVAAGVFLVWWPRLQTQAGTVSVDHNLTLMPPTPDSAPSLKAPPELPLSAPDPPAESPVRSVKGIFEQV